MIPHFDPDTLPCGLLVFDDRGVLHGHNRMLCQLLGYDAEDANNAGTLPVERLSDLLTPASRLMYLASLFTRLQQHGSIDEAYLSLRHAQGHDVAALLNVRRQPGPGEVRYLATVSEIHDRKRLEDELLRARRITEQLPGMVCQYLRRPDGSGAFPYVSKGVRELFGVSPDEARTSDLAIGRRLHADDREEVVRSFDAAARALSSWEHQFRIVTQGRERWVEARFSPQREPDGALLWHGYICDVSSRKALETLLQDKAVADQASRAKSEFLARVSHELRTPLNAVLGFSQLLAADSTLRLNPHQQKQLDHIEAAGRNLLQLINEVLDLTRIEAGAMHVQLAPVAVATLLAESLAMVELMARDADITLEPRFPPPEADLQVMADHGKLVQCLVNLLTNAIKYNRPHGRVCVRAHAVRDEVRIDVEDTGPGFTSEQLAHVFEPFNRLGAESSRIEGTGLGLSITRGLIERQGGRLHINSRAGDGSCFTMHLPAAGPSVAAVAAGPASTPAPAADTAPMARQRRVLYVEDNLVNRTLMTAIFDLRPHLKLVMAPTATQGLQQALAAPPDLLLLDVELPDFDGLTLLARMRDHAALREVPAFAVSANALNTDVQRALSAGFADYWTKPLDLPRTLAALDGIWADG